MNERDPRRVRPPRPALRTSASRWVGRYAAYPGAESARFAPQTKAASARSGRRRGHGDAPFCRVRTYSFRSQATRLGERLRLPMAVTPPPQITAPRRRPVGRRENPTVGSGRNPKATPCPRTRADSRRSFSGSPPPAPCPGGGCAVGSGRRARAPTPLTRDGDHSLRSAVVQSRGRRSDGNEGQPRVEVAEGGLHSSDSRASPSRHAIRRCPFHHRGASRQAARVASAARAARGLRGCLADGRVDARNLRAQPRKLPTRTCSSTILRGLHGGGVVTSHVVVASIDAPTWSQPPCHSHVCARARALSAGDVARATRLALAARKRNENNVTITECDIGTRHLHHRKSAPEHARSRRRFQAPQLNPTVPTKRRKRFARARKGAKVGALLALAFPRGIPPPRARR